MATERVKRASRAHAGARKRVAMNIQRLLADHGKRPEHLCKYLNSKSIVYDSRKAARGLSIDTLGRIADFFECDISELLLRPTQDR